MGGLFDDIFDDGDFEIASEEVKEDTKDEPDKENMTPDDWGTGRRDATWDTGRKPDVWNADEPWTTASDDLDCDDDCDPAADCDSCKGNSSPTMDDFFN
jgi:hypothetical protein